MTTKTLSGVNDETLRARLERAATHVHDTDSARLAALEQRDAAIVEAFEGGWKPAEIAAAAGVSPSMVYNVVAKA